MRIRTLLNLFLAATTLLAVLLTTGIHSYDFVTVVKSTMIDTGRSLAKKISIFSADYLLQENYAQLNDSINEFGSMKDVRQISISDARGTIVADSSNGSIGKKINITHWQGIAIGADTKPIIMDDDTTITITNPIVISGYHLGFCRIVMTTGAMKRQMHLGLFKGIIIAFAVILLSGILGFVASRSITTPLEKMRERTRLIQTGRFDAHPDIDGPHEIREISHGLNLMAEGIRNREKAIRESEGKYRIVLNNLNDGIFSANEGGDIIDANPAMVAMFGYRSPNEMRGINLYTKLCGENKRSVLEEGLASWGKFTLEYLELLRADGTGFTASITCSFVKESESNRFIVGIIRDMTETLKTTEHLTQSQKMETVGNLAGGLAHDFNNILGGIMGSTDLLNILIRKTKPDNQEKFISYLEIIQGAAERGRDMVSQLMTLSRKNPGREVAIDIIELLRDTIAICSNSFPREVSISLDEKCSKAICTGDPTHFQQVFLNLLINASHAMTIMRAADAKQGGTVTITVDLADAAAVSVWKHTHENLNRQFVRIAINDTGVGMDGATRQRIFEPFFSTKKNAKGTGLGMTMAYTLVRQHHGAIDIDSTPGIGTTVTVFLPLTDQPYDAKKSTDEVLAYGIGTILVIDDEEMIRSIAREILQECGYSVVVASSGDEGLARIRDGSVNPTAVILDASMPEKSGIETLAELTAMRPSLPVLMATGSHDEEILRNAVSAGARGSIMKPYTAMELSHRLKEIIA